MLDIDGDGLVSFKELLTVIKDAFSAREYRGQYSKLANINNRSYNVWI